MPLCGFNEKMLQGLKMFNEGLIDHGLLYRGSLNGETVDQGIRREVADMTRLLLDLHHIDDAAKRTITEGIVKYAMGFYLLVRQYKEQVDYDAIVTGLSDYFWSMDDTYYNKFDGRPYDMKELAQFLNDKTIV